MKVKTCTNLKNYNRLRLKLKSKKHNQIKKKEFKHKFVVEASKNKNDLTPSILKICDETNKHNLNMALELTKPVTKTTMNEIVVNTSQTFKEVNTTKVMEKNKSFEEDCFKFHLLSDSKVLLILKVPRHLFFKGSVQIQTLMGRIEILGYTMDSSDGVQTAFSTKGYCYLYLKALEGSQNDFMKKKDFVTQYLISRNEKDEKISDIVNSLTQFSVVVLLEKITDIYNHMIWPKFLFKHCSSYYLYPYKQINNNKHSFTLEEEILNCSFTLKDSDDKNFKTLQEWDDIEKDMLNTHCSSKTILVGGKNVGKSTLMRYFINKTLKKWKKVLVLDFDIGQCEFTIPACVSAVLVEKPLLGTNFTHMTDPIRSIFIGGCDVIQCLDLYMNAFKQITKYCNQQKEFRHIPWFINTMGFSKGLGLSIAASIIKEVCPTRVIQINSQDTKKNFKLNLNPKVVSRERFMNYDTKFSNLNYKFFCIPSGTEGKGEKNISSDSWVLSPKRSRQISLCTYLSKMLKDSSLNLLQLTPYMIEISKLQLFVLETTFSQKEALSAMNGNLVALCTKNQNDQEFPNCLGFGIVRAIDYDNGKLFLITPLEINKLHSVNCLVKGSLSLPDSFFLDEDVEGHVPYVSFTSNHQTTQRVKREFNANKMNTGSSIRDY
uniref:Polynucleotide 5'-hydroxyl-kinase NOL9 n=1 Tax=Clastoptera arizonana TaxID=38151 RepID=A0A1B6EDB5_9HEMI